MGRRTRRYQLGVLAAALVATAAACNGLDPLDPSLGAAVITRDPPDDVYGITVADDVVTATAASENTGRNMRVVFWRTTDGVSTDQQVCATWTGPDQDQQPGIALRAHDVTGGTRVITVTKNVWFYAYSVFNVHVMDSSNADEPFVGIAGRDLPGMRTSSSPTDEKPYPWRACARVVGSTVSMKVWPIAEAEPAWDDPDFGYSVSLPAGWEVPGHPGSHIGHLRPGASFDFSAIEVTDLDAPVAAGTPADAAASQPTNPPLEPTHVLRAP